MVVVENDECIGCETCVPVCPVQAITMQDGVAIINQETCTQCENCIATCPVEAIKIK